ncbi:MAG: nitrile hydratase subunit beta [Acidobacteria bacterium]|nr:MAG: nitrile hydratase subunit beta [Acidobacteriota bacterium]
MNGIHDMGGMHGMGPIRHERNEPVFHEPWEGRVYAMTRVVRAGGGRQNLDNSRHLLELLPPADYLRMTYYQRWYARLANQLVANAIVTREELDTGHAAAGSPKAEPRVTAAMVPDMVARRNSARREAAVAPRFKVGQRVRARDINPAGHTRLPRYARGKSGVIVRDHGVFVFPDTNAEFSGEKPQHVYSVRFAARELWGPDAPPRDCVHIDMWDDYLDRA